MLELLKRTVILPVVTAVLFLSAFATGSELQAQSDLPKYEMGTFYMCILVKGPNAKSGMPEASLVQAHFNHIKSLFAGGKAVLAGPFADAGRIVGIVVLNASSAEEARSIEEQDPLIKAAGLSLEVLKWWAAKNVIKPPQDPMKLKKYFLGILTHGPKWTPERTPETDKIQAGHMNNINTMAKAGKLVIAGPFENGGDYAGVFLFKVDSIDEAKSLSAADPAVQAGRLVVEVHPWMIAEGSLP